MKHEPMDRHCAYWDGTRLSFLARLVLGVRCVICSNVGVALGAGINPVFPRSADSSHDRDQLGICRRCGQGLTARDIVDGERPCSADRGSADG